MSRLQLLPQNGLTTAVQSVTTAIQQAKATQYAGSTSVVTTRTVTGNNPDFVASVSYQTVTSWQLTFTPDPTPSPDNGMVFDFFFDIVSQTGSGSYDTYTEQLLPTGASYTINYYIYGTTPGMSLTLDFVVVVYSIGTGTISIAQLS